MKLYLGCHNPFASSKLYSTNCLQSFFACGWWSELLASNLQRCSILISLFTRSGLWEMTRHHGFSTFLEILNLAPMISILIYCNFMHWHHNTTTLLKGMTMHLVYQSLTPVREVLAWHDVMQCGLHGKVHGSC